ncbi:hypothetical protein NQ315_009758 [Exocentrus adspersus]|uniref:Uncharacterized protein n=1 Tax=Exocentrus adspersus TaxID=1586481 RepID=A0AAV8WHI9_9CUCU|nr:hypothetical protein NQ315_009758 [Exocentrus adspersus]
MVIKKLEEPTKFGVGEAYMDEDMMNGNMSSYPYFALNVDRNVTTAVGQTAFLHCRVEQLGDKAKFPWSSVRRLQSPNIIIIEQTI